MSRLKKIFQTTKPYIIGMIHVKALPGTPNSSFTVNELVYQACKEAEIYKTCNVDSVLIENMHDVPYIQSREIGPEVTATMAKVCSEIRNILPLSMPCGIQILAGANKEALAVAHATSLQYIRAEGFIFSHIADEGIMNSCAGELLRYRKTIGAENICVLTDIKKKHCSHAITSDLTVEETTKAAEFFLSDGVIISGKTTGDPTSVWDLEKVRKISSLPVIIGSGVTVHNVENYMEADAIIVGSHFKRDGEWRNEVDKKRVLNFLKVVEEKRQKSKLTGLFLLG